MVDFSEIVSIVYCDGNALVYVTRDNVRVTAGVTVLKQSSTVPEAINDNEVKTANL
jgi:hypothetical protein